MAVILTPHAWLPRGSAPERNRPAWRRLLLAGALLAGALLAPPAGAAPTITQFPGSQTVAVGANVTFTVTATGTAPLSYQWYRGATAISGATTATLAIPNAQLTDSGIYAVAVTDSTGTTRTYTGYSRVFAAGYSHSLFVKSDGTLWAVGANINGQLGNGTNINRSIPENIATGVTAVAAGSGHSLFVKSDGSLWAMGNNASGQLGDGTTTSRNTPVQIAASGVAAVAAGTSHSLFLKTDGSVWAMGLNNSGQLGDGLGTSRTSPIQVATGVQSIAAGANQSFLIKTDGSLWAFGNNNAGQLGDGTSVNRATPVQVATGVSAISTANSHTLFVKTDGTAWGMGFGSSAQLGIDNFTTRLLPVQLLTGVGTVAAGPGYSLFLKTDGTVWALGTNSFGQFGEGATSQRGIATQVATGIDALSTGETHSHFLKPDNTLWASGNNSSGQLGDGSTTSRLSPQPVLVPSDLPAVLNVGVAPTITAQTASQAVNAASAFSLAVTATGATPLFYQWYQNGVAISGATGSSYFTTSFTLPRVGTYTVTVTNAYGSFTSAPINLTINFPVYPQVAVPGKAVAFPSNTGGTGLVTWQISTDGGTTWTPLANDGTYSGADTGTLRISNVTQQMANHLFRYQVTSGSTVATSGPTGITVFTSPLTLPTALLVERTSGKIYVTDAAAQTVLSVAPDLKLSVVAGKAGETGTANGPAASARFHEPGGFVLDAAGSMILADTSNSSIREINSSGSVSTFAGQSGSPGSADGNTAAARFNAPIGLTYDLIGSVLVTDQSDHTVRLIAGGMVQTVAGRVGIPGFADGQGTAAGLNAPTSIVVRRDSFASITWSGGNNGYGTIFVTDQGSHTIRTITASGLVGTYVGLASAAGFTNGSRTSARFRNPTGLAFDGDGNLYVADTGNHIIRRIDGFGNVTTFAGTPGVGGLMDGPTAKSQFLSPEGVAVDSARNVYVADTGNGVIRKITPTGTVSTLLILGNVPTITTQPANLSVTSGSSATFSVTATGEGTLSYQWKKDGTMIAGATSASYSIASAAAGNAGNYTVAVSNSWGTTESSIATLGITTPPPPTSGGGTSGGSSSGGGGGGGGAPSLPFLALLGLAAVARLRSRGSPVPN